MGNGYVLDPESPTEMARLINLDRAITSCMGGALVGIPSQAILKDVLDVACGPGGWVLDTAFALPGVEVAGVDISRTMVDYAHARALTQKLPNASFEVMDITQPLDFPDGVFDLINARFLVGVLRGHETKGNETEGKGEQWTALLRECWRLLRPGGIIRLVESDGLVVCTSPSLARLQRELLRAMTERGYGFSADGGATLGITPNLSRLLSETGFQSSSLSSWVFDTSGNSQYWGDGLRLFEMTYRLAEQRGLLKELPLQEDEEVGMVIDMMLAEMHNSVFGALTYGAVVSAVKPS